MAFAVSVIVVMILISVIFRVGVARSLMLCRPTLMGEIRIAERERRLTNQRNMAKAGLFAEE